MMFFICFLLLVYITQAQNQKTTIWSETFTYGVVSTDCQCQNWVDFWQFWIGDPSQVISITLGGSLTSTTYTCSGSAAQFVAFALATPPYETTQVTCESGIWYTGWGWNGVNQSLAGNAVGITAAPTVCSNYTAIRPCWPHREDWGGIGSENCLAPTQTFTVTVVSNIPTITVLPASVTWTDSFAYNVSATSTQCYNWTQFWRNTVPRSGTLSATIKSSINGGVSVSCSGPGVNLLATAFFTPTSNGQYHCNEGTVWYFNGIYTATFVAPAFPNTSAMAISSTPFCCSAILALRPCWDQPFTPNWGGFGGNNCGAPGQTFTATVTIGIGIFTIGCNLIKLLCNANYTANGYGISSSGMYTCSSAVWSPTVPTCNVVTTTTSTTTSSTTTTTTSTTTSTTKTTTTTSTTTKSPTTSTTSTSTTTAVAPSTKNVMKFYNLPMSATKTKIWWWPFLLGSVLLCVFAVFIFACQQQEQHRQQSCQQILEVSPTLSVALAQFGAV